MKIYCNEKLGFEIDLPDEWEPPKFGASHTPLGESIVFRCGYYEAVNIQIGPLYPEESREQTEAQFKSYTQNRGYTSLEFGRLEAAGRQHTWARYDMGGGKWAKKYLVRLSGIEYAITAICYYHNRLADRERVWDAAVASFRLLGQAPAGPPAATEANGKSAAAPLTPDHPADLRRLKARAVLSAAVPSSKSESVAQPHLKVEFVTSIQNKVALETSPADPGPQNSTLAFSVVAYTAILLFALGYIQFKVGLAEFFSFSSEAHTPLSNLEFNLTELLMLFGVGALICLIYLLGVLGNDRLLNESVAFFGFIDRTMQIHIKEKEILGGSIFSDYTRKSQGPGDVVLAQLAVLRHAVVKIISLPFLVGTLHPVQLTIFGGLMLWSIISKRPAPMRWVALFSLGYLFLCYRGFLFFVAKRKGVARFGPAKWRTLVFSSPSLPSAIQSASNNGVTPEFIERILSQESIINAIKQDLIHAGQLAGKEVWRLGLITPGMDRCDPRRTPISTPESRTRLATDYNYNLNLGEQLPVNTAAVLFNPSNFGLQADRLNVTHLLTNFPFPGNSPARSHRLSTEIKPGELVDLRNIQIDTGSAYDQISSLPLPEFLRRSGFPLKETYLDGDPLTAERGGTIVIDRGRLTTIYPSYFVHRRLIDPQGDLVDIGLDENFGARPLFEVKLRPAVSEHLYRCVSYHGYIPVVRYRSFPYSSEFLLPLLDTPMSDSGWADLFIDPKGFGRLFIAKQKTLAEWTEMLARLRELFYRTLAETDYHLLGLTKDRSRLNRYFGEKQHILEDYYLIQTWRLY